MFTTTAPADRRRACGLVVAACAAAFVAQLCGCENTLEVEGVGTGMVRVPGDLHLDSQADVDHVAGIVEVTGQLRLGSFYEQAGVDICDLSPLSSLERVGRLTVARLPGVESLGALRRLKTVEGNFQVRAQSSLAILKDLPALRCRSLSIEYNDSLTSLIGLPAGLSAGYVAINNNGLLETLDGLAGIDSLVSLRIRNNKSLAEFGEIGPFPILNFLYIGDTHALRSFGGLPALPALTRLEVDGPRDGTALELGLHDLPALEELHISGWVADPQTIAALPSLRSLYLETTFDEYTWLAGLGSLDILTLSTATHDIAYGGLGGLASLTNVSRLWLRSLPVTGGDLATLAGMAGLEEIHLNGLNALENLAPLDNLPDLRRLEVYHCDNIETLALGSGLPSLREIYLAWNDGLASFGIEAVAPDLLDLTVVSADLSASLGELASATGLEALSIRYCEGFTDLSGLNGFSRLRLLHLAGLDHLTDLAGLGTMPDLQVLSIQWNDSLASLHGLEGVTSLGSRLEITGNRALTDISALVNLEQVGEEGISVWYNHVLDNCVASEFFTAIPCTGPLDIRDNGPCADAASAALR